MPNFKEFIKGFEEKPEPKNPNPAPTPKPQEVKMEQPKPQEMPKPKQPKRKPSESSSLYKGVDIVSTPGGHFINDEKNSTQYSFETIDKAKEYIDNAEKAKGGMFDQSGLVTEKGKAASDEFKREKGIKDYYSLSNDQFNALAKEAMEKYGIKDFELAQEFLISNSQDDKDLDKLLEIRRNPKQGSFEQAFNDMSKPEQGLGDFNPSERIEDYQSGAKTHSENEFRLEALNDRGMYDFISKNRDYLYRKANSDPEGAIKDIIRHGQNNYGIKPENIRKDYVMEVLKEFYEDDEGAIPDFTKQEEFKPSEKIEEFNDYYGAKTNSERNLNLLAGNDRDAYEYISQNRDALAKEAEYDPASVLNKIKWHANQRDWARSLKGDSIRKDYLINVIKGIVED